MKKLVRDNLGIIHQKHFKKYGVVTSSTHNLTINRKKIRLPIITETKMTAHDWNIYVRKHAFAQMFIKSLKNRYAVTGL